MTVNPDHATGDAATAALASQIPRGGANAVTWPAVVGGAPGAVMAILQQLEFTQWWPPEQLRAQQLRQATLLLAHAAATVPFYREREAALAATGIRPGKALAEEAWQRLPILERRAVQDAGPALRSAAVPPTHGGVAEVTTTGSTGMPVRVLKTQLGELFWAAFTVRDHRWHRRNVAGKLALIMRDLAGRAGWPHGLALPNWGRATALLYDTGPAATLDIMTPIERQAEWLLREQPDHLLTFPTNLMFLARHFSAHGLALPRLRGVSTMGEAVTPDVRAACRAAFGVALQDMYSAEEVGYMALQCPEHEHYHLQAESAIVEVVDDAGRPVRAGGIGRVVVTPLHNFATPLIRYAIGDHAEMGPPCPCGRGLPVIARILGRTRNMVRLPDGRLHWAALESQRFAAIAPIIQYQIVQSASGVEMKLVVRRPLTADEERDLRAMVQWSLGHSFAIAFSYHEAIARGAGGKFEEFRSEVG